ncbi:uncharacterized protein DUF5063 [Dysgonomonas alginatilytica]|uniref:Uncharacterized protein DUF5063 n=1 Tax=Dysgonomonas alginatilytica TaxID=1605892 RepID=A0A2V3PKT8_9BACT|nr:DUF5063 domain-containing protein [Dysgonomonas alginatilytica]PXV62096.1 uncharacterized protein DUF5063 [Dysgonomonas alginatilytica]
MGKELASNVVFSKNVVEFVTVAVQYCTFLENPETQTSKEYTDKLTKLLPLLYLKAALLPETEIEEDIYPEITVTEDDYNYIISKLYTAYKENDTYLEVFLEDMKYSDTPIAASISEDIADIYQDIKNFISIYEQGIEENMSEGLYTCYENFKLYWGQKLVNVLRALHSLKYSIGEENPEEDDLDSDNIQDEW